MRARPVTSLLAAALTVGFSGSTHATEMHIASDRIAVVNGQRVFILGLYENPKDDAVLEKVAEAGFNLVRAKPTAESLDRIAKCGLRAWINTGRAIDLNEDAVKRRERLETLAATHAKHPALLVWEVPDEALWNCWYGAIQWRHEQEPERLEERIAGLDDAALARELHSMLATSKSLREAGNYAASESTADRIWQRLGETPPKPDYGLSNAPEHAMKLCRGIAAGYRLLRALDAAHPVWMNHAPRNQIGQLAAFNAGADIAGCDIYPVPRCRFLGHSDLGNQGLSSVGDYTDRMQAAAPGKPVWMVLQGFGWADIQPDRDRKVREVLRRPTLEESRFMAFDAIVHGARGLLYWGTHAVEKDGPFFASLLSLAHEIDALQPVLSAPDTDRAITVEFQETYGSVDRGVVLLGKEVDGKLWLLAVNEWTSPLTYTIRGLEGLNGVTYKGSQTDATAAVREHALTFRIPAESVQVLEPQP